MADSEKKVRMSKEEVRMSKEDKLVGSENYVVWSATLMNMLLVASMKTLINAITPREGVPVTDSADERAKAVIQLNVSKPILQSILNANLNTAAATWNWLRDRFGTPTAAKRTTLFRRLLLGDRPIQRPSIHDFSVRELIDEKLNIQQEFNAGMPADQQIPENFVVSAVWLNLPPAFSTYELANADNISTLAELTDKLVNEEIRIKDAIKNGTLIVDAPPKSKHPGLNQSLDTLIAFNMRRGGAGRGGRGKGRGHNANFFPADGGVKKHGGFNGGRGGGRAGRGGSRDSGGNTRLFCTYCKKTNHTVDRCFKRAEREEAPKVVHAAILGGKTRPAEPAGLM